MSYIESKVLGNNEKIVLEIKKSRWALVSTWIWGIVGFFLLFIPTIQAIYKTIAFKHCEYAITNKKAIEKYGIIQVHVDEMDLTKVENVTYNVTFWGRILGYSNICIQGANRNNINLNGIVHGEEVRRQINSIVDQVKANYIQTPYPQPGFPRI